MNKITNSQKGKNAELIVISYLKKRGYTLLFHQYLWLPHGEIDVIAQYKNIIIFVEVKYRKTEFAMAGELVNKSKQKKIIKTAELICMKHNWHQDDYIIRFDIALIKDEKITYIENAFTK